MENQLAKFGLGNGSRDLDFLCGGFCGVCAVKTISMGYIGNGHGVATGAIDSYITMINRFGNREINKFSRLIFDNEIISRLQFGSCQARFHDLASKLLSNATGVNAKTRLNAIVSKPKEGLYLLHTENKFKALFQ